MNARTVALALIVTVLLAPASLAQFAETVEVRITNLDAVVTDRNGNPVSGLTKDDFEIFENGKRQPISNFVELRETAPAGTIVPGTATPPAASPNDAAAGADIRPRVVTVFVDNATLEMGNRNTVLPKLREFLHANVRPGDAVAIYLWSDGLRAPLELTDDRNAIDKALNELGHAVSRANPAWRSEFEKEIDDLIAAYAPRKPYMSQAITVAALYALRQTSEMRQKVEALKSVISSLRGVEGRKALVLLTQSLSINPAEETFYFLDSIHEQFEMPDVLRPSSEARHYVLHGVAESISLAANTAGVTLYPINASGLATDNSIRDASQRVFLPTRSGSQLDSSSATLQAIAEDTGGRAVTGSSNWALAFNSIANDLGVYYSLGYRASGERQDRTKKVEVRVKNQDYQVRTRKAIVEQTVLSEMNDAVTSSLFHSRVNNDLGIRTAIGEAKPDGGKLVHPVTLAIPTSTLTLIPDGSDFVGSFSVFTAFLRDDGEVSKVGKETHQLRVAATTLEKRKNIAIKINLAADPRVTAIALGVMDEASRATGFKVMKLPTFAAGQ